VSGLSMGQVGAFGPLGPRRDRYGSFGLGDARSTSETLEWAAERWRRDDCSAKGAAYVNGPASSGCHFNANLAILAGKRMALAQIGLKGHSVSEVEQAILAGKTLSGFSPSQLSAALAAGQQSAMSTVGIPVPPKAVPRPPRPGSVAEGGLIQSLEKKIAELMSARNSTATPSPSILTEEQKVVLGRMTPHQIEAARRAEALAAVRAAQAEQHRLAKIRAALPAPAPFRIPGAPVLAASGRMEPWGATAMLLLGAGVAGTLIYSAFGRRR